MKLEEYTDLVSNQIEESLRTKERISLADIPLATLDKDDIIKLLKVYQLSTRDYQDVYGRLYMLVLNLLILCVLDNQDVTIIQNDLASVSPMPFPEAADLFTPDKVRSEVVIFIISNTTNYMLESMINKDGKLIKEKK